MTAVIRIKELTRAYEMGTERILALRDVTLDIARNEYVAIMRSPRSCSTSPPVRWAIASGSTATSSLSGA